MSINHFVARPAHPCALLVVGGISAIEDVTGEAEIHLSLQRHGHGLRSHQHCCSDGFRIGLFEHQGNTAVVSQSSLWAYYYMH